MRCPLVEVVAQVIREVRDQLACLLGTDADQRRDGIEGVEQEVGLILLCSAVNSALRVISLSCSMRDTSIWVEMSWERPTAISLRSW